MGRWIQVEPLKLEVLVREVTDHGCGALVVFSGNVRDNNEGRAVRALTYDAHVAMAEKVLKALEEEVVSRFGVRSCRIQHRVGSLHLGEPSVLVVVGAAHRSEAFDAARYAIDTLKVRAPIWKEEHYEDGQSRYIDGVPLETSGSGELR